MLEKKPKGKTRALGAVRNMPVVDTDFRRKVKERRRPSTAMSMKDYLEDQEEKQKRVDEMQKRVDEAVKDYMSNLIQTQTVAAPSSQPAPVIIAQPIAFPVGVPVISPNPNNQLETFVSTGLELLEKDLPRQGPCPPTPAQVTRPSSPAKSFIRPIPKSIPEPKPMTPEKPVTPKKSQEVPIPEPRSTPVRPATARPASPVKEPVRPPSPVKSVKEEGQVRPQTAKSAGKPVEECELKAAETTVAGDIKRPDEKFQRHWLTWPRTPSVQSERAATPATPLYRPKNPTKLRRTYTSLDQTKYSRPVFTPVPNGYLGLDQRPPSAEPQTINFVAAEPSEYGRPTPFVPAFQTWLKSASPEEKGVVYRMMKTLKAQPTYNGTRPTRYVSYTNSDTKAADPNKVPPYGVRTSMPVYRPPEMYQTTEGPHPNPCHSCEDFAIRSLAQQVGAAPEFYGIGYSRYYNPTSMYDYKDFDFSRFTHSWEEPKPFVSPYFRLQQRPMAKHQNKQVITKEYIHENSFFQDAHRPYRSHFVIAPDWVSENTWFKRAKQQKEKKYF